MRPPVGAVLVAGAGLTAAATSGTDTSDLVGTWTTKSNSTLTGSAFYNPKTDSFIEPAHTGISYSFTADGHYEESYYRAIANPTNPECPSSIMQWQHGTYTKLSNGSLILEPIAIDGRQLISDPCNSKHSTFSHYDQSELIYRYSQYTDPFHKIARLDLYKFNQEALQPMYRRYDPPQMLPTTTLKATATAASTSKSKLKRSLDKHISSSTLLQDPEQFKSMLDAGWWFGLGMVGVGSVLAFCL